MLFWHELPFHCTGSEVLPVAVTAHVQPVTACPSTFTAPWMAVTVGSATLAPLSIWPLAPLTYFTPVNVFPEMPV